jgi:hypothetical protein
LGEIKEILTVPRSLRPTLGEEPYDALIELMNKANRRQKEDILVSLEEKFERRLAEEISKVNEKIAKVEPRISDSNANMIKWMFIFWIGQIGSILGIFFAFFKSLRMGSLVVHYSAKSITKPWAHHAIGRMHDNHLDYIG